MSVPSEKPLRVAILGCGLMGTALLQGWLQQTEIDLDFTAYVRTQESLARLQRDIAIYTAHSRVRCLSGGSLVETLADADIVVLAFLPKSLKEVLRSAGVANALSNKVVVSVLAGVPLQQLEQEITSSSSAADGNPSSFYAARLIPTLAAKFGQSATIAAADADPQHAAGQQSQLVRRVFSVLGGMHYVPEPLMDDATAIGATTHALGIIAVDAIVDASVAEGVPRATALALAIQSLRSVGGLMLEGGMSPEAVKASMSTPGGITLNAVVALDAGARAGIAAATRRAISYTRQMND